MNPSRPNDDPASRSTRFAAYAFMATMPWAAIFLDAPNPHDLARMFVSLVMVLAAWAWWRDAAPWLSPRPALNRLAAAMLALGTASVLLAPLPPHAALEASAFVLLVVVARVFARTPLAVLERELPPALALAVLLSLLLELPQLMYAYADSKVPRAADFGFMYMNHRFLNHVQTVLLPMAFIPLLLPAPRWARVAAWAGVAGGLALLWRTGGRGTMISTALFMCCLPWLLKGRARPVWRPLALALLAGGLFYGLAFVLPPVLLGMQPQQWGSAAQRLAGGVNDAARVELWTLALRDALAHPWLGAGPMHYAHLPNLLAAHPHNSVLQVAAEWGLPMTVLMLVALGLALRRSLATVRSAAPDSASRALLSVSLLATAAGCIDSLVSGTLVMPVSQLWWVVALGSALAGRAPVPTGLGARGWLAGGLMGALVVLHLGLSALTYRQSVQPAAADPAHGNRTHVPRYWINGHF